MRPVYQTRFGTEGNSLSACIASILEIPIEVVDVSPAIEKDWFSRLSAKLLTHRRLYVQMAIARSPAGLPSFEMPPGALFIGVGMTDRSAILHSVVCEMGSGEFEVVHDPHPAGGGLDVLTHIGFVLPVEALYL